jgi:hypothetical protein
MILVLSTSRPPNQQIQLEVVRQLSYRNNDHSVKLCQFKGTSALFFQSKMSCDVDGSPNAYHPLDDGLALDVIGSAGGRRKDDLPSGPLTVLPGDNVVVYVAGAPYIQPDGPFKGYYVSETSLENPQLSTTDPTRYLDARTIQYVVLPGGLVPEASLGDVIAVFDPVSERVAYAVYGDIGPGTESGEASLATLKGLGLPAVDGKSSPGEGRNDLFYLIFPNTWPKLKAANKWPLPKTLIDRIGTHEFRRWGGVRKLKQVLAAESDPAFSTQNRAG